MNKKTFELEERDIAIEQEIIVDDDNNIEVYLATYFDVDKKFNLNTRNQVMTWLNMYATYNPEKNELKITCVIDKPTSCEDFNYVPTEKEKALIIQMITKKIQYEYQLSPQEFIKSVIE